MQAIIYMFMNTLAILGIPVLCPVYSPDLSKATRPHREANVTSEATTHPHLLRIIYSRRGNFSKDQSKPTEGEGSHTIIQSLKS